VAVGTAHVAVVAVVGTAHVAVVGSDYAAVEPEAKQGYPRILAG